MDCGDWLYGLQKRKYRPSFAFSAAGWPQWQEPRSGNFFSKRKVSEYRASDVSGCRPIALSAQRGTLCCQLSCASPYLAAG